MLDGPVVPEVLDAVVERGHVSKAEIIETWDLAEEDYGELQYRLLSANPLISKGPKRTGGFEVRNASVSASRPTDGCRCERLLLAEKWEKEAVGRLTDLLTGRELKLLLGDLQFAVRNLRKRETGVDSSTKSALATALILQHGIDLFCEPGVRRRVGDACGVRCPQRWHPGKGTAVEFVAQTGFPRELAGIPTPERLPDYEYLEGRLDLHPLEDFQREVKKKLDRVLAERGQRAIVTLPTGAGKTRVAVESVRDWLTKRYDVTGGFASEAAVLWLAHTEELCEQGYACFRQVWTNSENVCPVRLMRFWGHYTKDLIKHASVLREILSQPTVLISTPQRIVNLLDDRVEGGELVIDGLREALGVVVVDEAHRAAAPSYRRILRDLMSPERSVAVAGLTATPFRMEYLNDDPEEGTRELKDIFQNLIEPVETLGEDPRDRLERLQQMEVLAGPAFREICTHTVISVPDVPEGEFLAEEDMERVDRIMALRADKTQRRVAILEHLLPLANEPANSILYFGPSVRDAECMAFLLRHKQIPAAVISGRTRDVTRRQTITNFKQHRIRVLCNCEVLTTGFDAPRVTHIVVARPTVSGVLYEQMVGRGLRGPRFGGTKSCVILDCHDDFRGRRPPLGYESLRKVWTRPATRERIPAESDGESRTGRIPQFTQTRARMDGVSM